MIAEQIKLLTERAEAVAQLVCSLKTENRSLKQNLLSVQPQINTLLNEIKQLKAENETLKQKRFETKPQNKFANGDAFAFFGESTAAESNKNASDSVVFNQSQLTMTEVFNVDVPTQATSSQSSEPFDYQRPQQQMQTTTPQPSNPFERQKLQSTSQELTSPEKRQDFDPFFDTFSQFDEIPDNPQWEPETEFYNNIEEESSDLPPQNKTEATDDEINPYSKLDIFY